MNIKAVIYFAAGVVAGAAATFFAVKGYFEKQKDDAVTEAWDDAREHFKKLSKANADAVKNRLEKLKIMENSSKKDEKPAEKQAEKESAVDIKALRKKAKDKVRSYRRNVFSDPPQKRDIRIAEEGTDSDDTEYPDDVEVIPGPSEGLRDDPYIIDADQWNYDNRGFDRETIYVYSDGTCVDEDERIVDDIENLIGKDNFDMLADLADEDGCVLIRNEMRSSDFELLLQDEPYIPDTAPVRDD